MVLGWHGSNQSGLLSFINRSTSAARSCLLIVLAAFPCISRGQSVDLAGIAHVAFRVSNVEATRAFYVRLGFQEAFVFSKDGHISQDFIKINDSQFIELYPKTLQNNVPGFMHLCFESDNLMELNRSYLQRGLSPSVVKKAAAGNLLFTLRGPEDQNIEYTQYMPGSLHENDRSKHLGADRISKHLQTVTIAMRDENAAQAFYTDQLSFHATGKRHGGLLLLPGASGESIAFKPLNKTHSPDITLEVGNIHTTAQTLRSRGFAVRVAHHAVFITDPDGRVVEFSSQRSIRTN
jgi:catechol 2,3-dioxygenase-like lactoylglutathione lyase family enzyme